MSELSLFGIDNRLHELMTTWQDAAAPEEMVAAELAIQEYAIAEVRKVDGIRAYLRMCEAMESAAKQEAATQSARAKAWHARADRLRSFVFDILGSFGKDRVEGKTGVMFLKGNGGCQPLVITDECLIPDELCVWEGEIDGAAWRILMELMALHPASLTALPNIRMKRTPHKSAIAMQLGRRCDTCAGTGFIDAAEMRSCAECSGSGKCLVAGARLEQRGTHLEVR